MLIITDPADVQDPALQRFLTLRFQQLASDGYNVIDIARFHVVQSGENIDAIEDQLGFPVMINMVDGMHYGHIDFEPSWEYIADHGTFYECVYVLDDSGFGHVLLVEDCDGVDADLRALCGEYCSNEREPGRYEGPEHP
jgi:hypothetical protein